VIGDRWGVTEDEVALRYPCDELVPLPAVQLWRGVTVDAPPDEVWAWLRQLQLAPYSYDWIDNLGKRSPRTRQDLPDPRPGEHFSTTGGRKRVGRVLSVEPGEQLTAEILGAVMSYVVRPHGTSSRLLLKIVMRRGRPWSRALAVGDWPMARRQLLTLKECAEAAS
jgi:hypothetical protein